MPTNSTVITALIIVTLKLKNCHHSYLHTRHYYHSYYHSIITFEPRQANLCLRAFRHDKFNCACPAIQRGQGSGFLSEGSSWLTACMSEQRMRRLAWTFAAHIGDKYQIRLMRPVYHHSRHLLSHISSQLSLHLSSLKPFTTETTSASSSSPSSCSLPWWWSSSSES